MRPAEDAATATAHHLARHTHNECILQLLQRLVRIIQVPVREQFLNHLQTKAVAVEETMLQGLFCWLITHVQGRAGV